MTSRIPQDVIRRPQTITRSNTKEVVKEHIQRDNEVSKERMLQHSSSVAKIGHRSGSKRRHLNETTRALHKDVVTNFKESKG